MSKKYLLNLLINKGVITFTNKYKKKHCWEKNFDEECKKLFNLFSINYRTPEEAWFCLLNDIEPQQCKICGKLAKFTGNTKRGSNGYNTVCETCSSNAVEEKICKFKNTIYNKTPEDKQLSFIKRKQTNKEKYGDENYTLFGSKSFKNNLKNKYGSETYNNREKYKNTCLLKYGVTNNLLLRTPDDIKKMWDDLYDDIIYKRQHTCIEKYNVKNYFESDEFKQKSTQTKIKKYGSILNFYNEQLKKLKETNLLKYGVEFYNNKELSSKTREIKHSKFEEEYDCTRYSKCIELYGQGWQSLNIPVIYNKRYRYIENKYIAIIKNYITEIHNIKNVSKQEIELFNYIKTLTNKKIYRNVKNIIYDNSQHYELDIYIPDMNLAIEYNGTYWHSNLLKEKYYHQTKTKLCYSKNIQLIHIYEYEWINKKDEIKNKLYELFNNKDCSSYNWVPVNEFDNYILTEPNIIKINKCIIYDEGKFIKKQN